MQKHFKKRDCRIKKRLPQGDTLHMICRLQSENAVRKFGICRKCADLLHTKNVIFKICKFFTVPANWSANPTAWRPSLIVTSALFRNKRFMLDEMTQQNTSKLATFYIHENPKFLFPFFISCYSIFSLINALVDRPVANFLKHLSRSFHQA